MTILESGEQLASEMALPLKWIVMDKLNKNKVNIITEVKYDEVTSEGVVIMTKDGSKKTIEADTIIVAAGTEPDKELLVALQGKVPEVFLAGDCSKMSFIKDSIADGSKIASAI